MRRLLLTALLVALFAACTSDDTDDSAGGPSRLDRADRRMVRILDATAAEVLPGRTGTRPEGDEARVGCHDVVGRSSGRASAGYTLHFPVEPEDDAEQLLRRVRSYWRERGYDAEIDRRRSRLPAVRTELDDLRLSFEVVTFNDLLVLAGGTNCLPD